jgi:hypothetical protein
MDLYKKKPFTWNKENYEIRVLYDDTLINVLAFFKNRPANGFRHQIRLPKNCDVKEILGLDIVEELIENSKGEIFKNRWQKISDITNKS